MTETEDLTRRAARLRAAFDHSFTVPPLRETLDVEDFLAIRVAGDQYLIRLRDIIGIVARRPIVSVPARAPGLVGIAGIRGEIVPVFSLSSLLGYGDDPEPPTWTVLCNAKEPIGLGFAELDGYLRLPRSAAHGNDDIHVTKNYVSDLASTEAGVRPIVAVSLVVADVCKRSAPQQSEKEQ